MSKGRKRLAVSLVCLLALLAAVLLGVDRYGPGFGVYLRKPTARAYGERAIALMNNGYYSSTDEWRAARAKALEALQDVQTYEETYPILSEAIAVAGGKHSRVVLPRELTEMRSDVQMPSVSETDGIVTIALPEFLGSNEQAKEYARTGIDWLRAHSDAKGVILDLRHNTGGDVAPMVLAVSPLLPDGDVLYVENAGGIRSAMTLKDGAFSGGSGISVESFKLPGDIPIAILTDERTGSSGEATLLAFRGMENVRVFGAPTAGYASANMTFTLFDGAQLWLTVGADVAVRTGEVFCDEPIEPDEPTDTPREAALSWLFTQAEDIP